MAKQNCHLFDSFLLLLLLLLAALVRKLGDWTASSGAVTTITELVTCVSQSVGRSVKCRRWWRWWWWWWPVTVSGQMGKGKEIALVKQHVQRMNSSSSSSEGDGAQCPAQLRHLRLLSCQTCGGCCCCCCCSRDNLILELALLRQR